MTAVFRVLDWAAITEATRAKVNLAAAYVLQQAAEAAPRSERHPKPKDPSAPITGNLGNSLHKGDRDNVYRDERQGRDPVVVIGTTVHYGVYQEFGTRNIPPRPFLGPALEAARKRYG